VAPLRALIPDFAALLATPTGSPLDPLTPNPLTVGYFIGSPLSSKTAFRAGAAIPERPARVVLPHGDKER